MRHEQDRHAVLVVDPPQQVEHLARRLRVEGAGRLVRDEHVGAVRQGPGDADALLLAARELGGVLEGLVRETDEVEQLLDAVDGLVAGEAREPEG
nr:hypothetical protein GCM10025699_76640 [Microbacterium flavescens]